jgi:hypothetical protein
VSPDDQGIAKALLREGAIIDSEAGSSHISAPMAIVTTNHPNPACPPVGGVIGLRPLSERAAFIT